jgi:flagellar biosynthesis/type III secretory pathway protein FliH
MRAVLASNGPPHPDPEAMEAMRLAIDNLVHARSVVFETAAAQIAELAATIARRVISTELSLRPEIVRKLVDEGLRALEREDHLLIRLGGGFAEQQARLVEDFQSQGEQVEVIVDPTLSTFGCVVETDHGWVDESVESRLAALLHELRSDEVQSDDVAADDPWRAK